MTRMLKYPSSKHPPLYQFTTLRCQLHLRGPQRKCSWRERQKRDKKSRKSPLCLEKVPERKDGKKITRAKLHHGYVGRGNMEHLQTCGNMKVTGYEGKQYPERGKWVTNGWVVIWEARCPMDRMHKKVRKGKFHKMHFLKVFKGGSSASSTEANLDD